MISFDFEIQYFILSFPRWSDEKLQILSPRICLSICNFCCSFLYQSSFFIFFTYHMVHCIASHSIWVWNEITIFSAHSVAVVDWDLIPSDCFLRISRFILLIESQPKKREINTWRLTMTKNENKINKEFQIRVFWVIKWPCWKKNCATNNHYEFRLFRFAVDQVLVPTEQFKTHFFSILNGFFLYWKLLVFHCRGF